MRFMVMVMTKEYGAAKPGTQPSEEAMAAMGKFNEELVKAGVVLGMDGLHPPSMGARVTVTNGKREVLDGPYSEAREVVGGYWMLDVKDKAEAIEWVKRAPFFHDAVVDIRRVQEPADFAPSPAIEHELEVGKKLAEQNAARAKKK